MSSRDSSTGRALPCKQEDAGSIPALGSCGDGSSKVERSDVAREVVGSSPTRHTFSGGACVK